MYLSGLTPYQFLGEEKIFFTTVFYLTLYEMYTIKELLPEEFLRGRRVCFVSGLLASSVGSCM
jgi:hypothetical protein